MTPSSPRQPWQAAFLDRRVWRWAFAGAVVGLLALAGLLIRLDMLSGRLPIEGQWAVNIEYGPWYLASHGRLFDVTGELPAVSNYTSGVNYGAVDVVHTLLHGSALIVAGETDPKRIGAAYFGFPWQALILVPLAVMALYFRLARTLRVAVNPLAVVLLYAFAVFSHYAMVNWALSGGLNLPYGWVMLIGVYWAVLARTISTSHKVAWSTLLALLLILVQPTYHSTAVAVVIILGSVAVTQRVSPFRFVPVNTLALAGAAFLAFLVYNATPFLRAYSVLGLNFLQDLLRSNDTAASQYQFRLSGPLAVLQYVNYAAIGVIVLIALELAWRRRRAGGAVLWHHTLWIAACVPLGIGFFAWNGVLSMGARLLQIGTLLAMCGAAIVLLETSDVRRAIVGGAIAIATICTLVSTPLVRLGDIGLVTADEWAALGWYQSEAGCDRVLLTDFRIGPVATYLGCFNVIGPTAAKLARSGQADVLTGLYYSADPAVIAGAVDAFTTSDGQRADLILVSAEMTRTGPVLPDGRLQPISPATWFAYGNLPGWNVVYRNASVTVLGRRVTAQRAYRRVSSSASRPHLPVDLAAALLRRRTPSMGLMLADARLRPPSEATLDLIADSPVGRSCTRTRASPSSVVPMGIW